MGFYDRLVYKTHQSGGKYNWLGNLRWYVTENEIGRFSFRCISALKDMTHDYCRSNRTFRGKTFNKDYEDGLCNFKFNGTFRCYR